ncbi:hypothetical protein [Pseudonocardia sp.]|uniref:hypothetical protein n=1 Tax=Pseudonocardia sp. TaxID=60912 RepID=UPI0031FDE892
MQRKLHHWAKTDPGQGFDDIHNLIYDPSFLVVAWERVRGNKGARTPESTGSCREWVFEADIAACFDEIGHTALMARVRGHALTSGFWVGWRRSCWPGFLSEEGLNRETRTGTAEWDPVTAAGQHRPVRTGRALHPQMGGLGMLTPTECEILHSIDSVA